MGCQIVALNWQTSEKYMWINEALFKFYSNGFRPRNSVKSADFSNINIYSGKYISKKPVSTYVRLSTVSSTSEKTYKTNIHKDNGFCPIWKGKFEINSTSVGGGLLFVIFEVLNTNGNLLAHRAISSSDIKKGYQYIDLTSDDNNNFETPPSIFIRVY